MQPGGVYQSGRNDGEDPLSRLAASARGWHSIQMAVLGFIGICGVLRSGDGTGPSWLQWLAGLLAGGALVMAVLAIALVGRVAYPFYGGTAMAGGDATHLARLAGQLRSGIRTTFVAVTLIVIAALSGWWPTDSAGGGSVQIRDASGRTWCGVLTESPAGSVGIQTADGALAIRIDAIVTIGPVAGC
jgi:hypothetical protein